MKVWAKTVSLKVRTKPAEVCSLSRVYARNDNSNFMAHNKDVIITLFSTPYFLSFLQVHPLSIIFIWYGNFQDLLPLL
jgi:hypothetical protein